MLLEWLKRVITKPAATEPAATALWLRPLLKSAEIEELRRGGPTMPNTIPAAMASAISGPLSVKMHSFLRMLLDRTRELAPTQTSTQAL